jgi:anti-sigma B factor antagonist
MSNPDNIQVTASGDADCRILKITGEVNLRTSPDLHARMLAEVQPRPKRLIIDLADVPYMDSSGVGTLVDVKRRVDRYEGHLILAGLQKRVLGVFEITQLHQFFRIATNLDEAKKL